jgi:hypothetical protein
MSPMLYGASCATVRIPADVDYSLIQPLAIPARPERTITNGDVLELLRDMAAAIREDNVRKAELLNELRGLK